MKILLVEDHKDTARTLAKLLQLEGHCVQAVNGYAAALDLASHEHFDLLLCDIGLPDGDGCELLERLHAHHPIKAIAISGYGMKEDVDRVLKSGFLAHLLKPVAFEQVQLLLKDLTLGPPRENQPSGDAQAL